MAKAITLSTVIDSRIKKAASAYCKRHGVKLQYFVEQSLLERLEDEDDLELYRNRKDEETIPLESLLNRRKKTS